MSGGKVICGATNTAVMVGSLAPPTVGSSVRIVLMPVPLTLPWLVTEEVFAGKGVLMVTSKVMVTVPPDATCR
jgi:hypothetical protein